MPPYDRAMEGVSSHGLVFVHLQPAPATVPGFDRNIWPVGYSAALSSCKAQRITTPAFFLSVHPLRSSEFSCRNHKGTVADRRHLLLPSSGGVPRLSFLEWSLILSILLRTTSTDALPRCIQARLHLALRCMINGCIPDKNFAKRGYACAGYMLNRFQPRLWKIPLSE